MTSTALDAVIAIVVIGAAITTLLGPGGNPSGTPSADPTLETLETGTTVVNYTYSIAAGTDPSTGTETETGADRQASLTANDGSAPRRTASGSYAELLGQAALATVTVDGESLTAIDSDFRDAVDAATTSAIPPRTQVVVLWRPYRGSHIQASLSIGPTPPPNADVAAASTTVPNGFPPAQAEATSAAEADGYTGVSRVFADRIVAGFVPSESMALALRSRYPVAPLAAHRYASFGDAYGVDLQEAIRNRHSATANDQLATALAERIETDLRAEFDSPDAAARGARIDRIELVVRRWA